MTKQTDTKELEAKLEDVAILKLVSGEEVMAFLMENAAGGSVNIQYPIILEEIPGTGKIDMKPWCRWTPERKFTFNVRNVMFVTIPEKETAEYYFNLIFPQPIKETPKIILPTKQKVATPVLKIVT